MRRALIAGILALVCISLGGCMMQNPLASLEGTSEINGSVYGGDFDSYRLSYAGEDGEYRVSGNWSTTAINLSGEQREKRDALLGHWDSGQVADGRYVLRLRTQAGEHAVQDRFHVVIDNYYISSPSNESFIPPEDFVSLRGKVAANDLDHYVVRYKHEDGDQWKQDGVRLPEDGEQPVDGDRLAVIDTGQMERVGLYKVQLVAYLTNGRNETDAVWLKQLKEDQYEPDDSFDTANRLKGTQEHTIYPEGDEDYLKVATDPSTSYMAHIRYEPSRYSLVPNVRLFDESQVQKDYESWEGDGSLVMRWNATGSSHNYLKLYSAWGDRGSYSVEVSRFRDSDKDGSPDRRDCAPYDPDVAAPFHGMRIKGNMQFCEGSYDLLEPVVLEDGANVSCRGTRLSGSSSGGTAFEVAHEATVTVRGCSARGFGTVVDTEYSPYLTGGADARISIVNNSFFFNTSTDSLYTYEALGGEAEHYHVSGNRISGFGTAMDISEVRDYTVKDNDLINVSTAAITGGDGSDESDGTIVHNRIRCQDSSTGLSVGGIMLEDADMISGNNISGCDYAISIEGGHEVRILDNRIEGSSTGIRTRQKRGVIEENTVVDTETGIRHDLGPVKESSSEGKIDVEILRNLVSDNTDGLLLEGSESVLVRDNRVNGNSRGVVLEGATDNSLKANIVTQNEEGMYFTSADSYPLEDSTDNHIVSNELYNNTEYNVVNDQESDITFNITRWHMDSREAIHETIKDGRDEPSLGSVNITQVCTNSLPRTITDDVYLCAGNYTVERNVTFASDDAGLSCMESSISGYGGASLIARKRERVSVQGCDFRGIGVMMADSRNMSIRECSFRGGEYAIGGRYLLHSNIEDNTFKDVGVAVGFVEGFGNRIRANTFGELIANRSENNVHAVSMKDSYANRIEGNRFMDSKAGISDDAGFQNTIRDNHFDGQEEAVHLVDTERFRIVDNMFDEVDNGVVLRQRRSDAMQAEMITHNTFQDVGGYAIINNASLPLQAPENYFGVDIPPAVEELIYDNSDNSSLGRVIFEDLLTSPPPTGGPINSSPSPPDSPPPVPANTTSTCNDGIRNQFEEGVDCGGPCPPCTNTAQFSIENLSGVSSETVAVPVELEGAAADIYSLSFNISYTASVLSYTGRSDAGDIVPSDALLDVKQQAEGVAHVSVSSSMEPIREGTSGNMITLYFSVKQCSAADLNASSISVGVKPVPNESAYKELQARNGHFSCAESHSSVESSVETVEQMRSFSDLNPGEKREKEQRVRPLAEQGSTKKTGENGEAQKEQKEVVSSTEKEDSSHVLAVALLFGLLIAVIAGVVVEVGSSEGSETPQYHDHHYSLIHNYLEENYKKGFSLEALQHSLIQKGWDSNTVQSISEHIRNKQRPNTQQLNSDQIAQFVSDSLQKGYSPEQVESILVNNNVPRHAASQVVRSMQSQVQRDQSQPSAASSNRARRTGRQSSRRAKSRREYFFF